MRNKRRCKLLLLSDEPGPIELGYHQFFCQPKNYSTFLQGRKSYASYKKNEAGNCSNDPAAEV